MVFWLCTCSKRFALHTLKNIIFSAVACKFACMKHAPTNAGVQTASLQADFNVRCMQMENQPYLWLYSSVFSI